MAAAVARGDVEEGGFGGGIVAVIGEGRGLHADQRGHLIRGGLRRPLVGHGRLERSNAVALRLHALRREVGESDAAEAFRSRSGSGRGIPVWGSDRRKLSLDAAACAGGRRYVGGKGARVRRTAALNQDQRERHKQTGEQRPSASRRRTARRSRQRYPARNIKHMVLRIGSDHPPTVPSRPGKRPIRACRTFRLR